MTITSPALAFTINPAGGVLDSRVPGTGGGGGTPDEGALYVSLTGSDANPGTISLPKRTPAIAASALTTGQTLYFRAGTYDIPTSTNNRNCAIVAGANNCKLAAYPGEQVTLRGGRNGTNFGVFPTGGTIGSGSRSGTLISGFTIQGMVMFDGCPSGSRPTRVENCDISVGGDGWTGTNQGGVVWIDDADNIELVNCYVHDNGVGSESSNPGNNGLIMGYDTHNALISRCTFKNSTGNGITLKDDVSTTVIRYCWLDNIANTGVWTGNNAADPYDLSVTIHNNLFTRVNTSNSQEWGGIGFAIETSQCIAHNNTFHGCSYDLTEWAGNVPYDWFNNLHSASTRYLNWPYPGSDSTATYLDYNQYHGAASPKWVYTGITYTTLAAWKVAANNMLAGAEVHSIGTNPNFLNASGLFNTPSDFKRSAYPAEGRGGGYPSVIGCYVTGDEIIGYTP